MFHDKRRYDKTIEGAVNLMRSMTYIVQPAFTCSKLTIETLEQGMKYVQS